MAPRLVLLFLVALLAACTAEPAAEPTPPVQPAAPTAALVDVTPIPAATATAIPTVTATSTATPRPTAFITAPAAGQAALIPILMYHHLADLPKNAGELGRTWTVSPENFDAQMAWLAQDGYHAITFGQLAAHFKRGSPLPAKPVLITFDDGWAEQYSVAFPTLLKYGLMGTFFVYTNPLGYGQFLTWPQAQEMAAAGMEFGSHTLSHPHLRTLTPDAAAKEITDSKLLLEKRLGKPIVAFDYPSGEYNNAIIDLVQRAGYQCAVTIAAGYKQKADELFTLHRTRVSYDDSLEDVIKRFP